MGKCFSICMGLSQSSRQNQRTARTPADTKISDTQLTALKTAQEAPTNYASDTSTSQGTGSQANPSRTAVEKRTFSSAAKPQLVTKASNGMEHVRKLSFPSRDADSKLSALFETYRDSVEDDCILAEGVEKFCDDLKIKPEDFRILVLAWKFNAQAMCKFTRNEFISGCKAIKADSIRAIQSKLPDLVKEVKDPSTFKDFYRWAFKFGVDSEAGQRTLPRDIAISLWSLVFTQNKPQILDQWLNFLEVHPSIKGISKDTWDMFINLTEVIGNDLSLYDDKEAWPSLFDDFVEYENDRQNQNVTEEAMDIDQME